MWELNNMREICTVAAYVLLIFIIIYPLFLRFKWKGECESEEKYKRKIIKDVIIWLTGIVMCMICLVVLFVMNFF